MTSHCRRIPGRLTKGGFTSSVMVKSFGSCVSLSRWLVTVTSGSESSSCACSGVLSAHILTSSSLKTSGAPCISTIVQRRRSAGEGRRPAADGSCIESHASNCVQKRDMYERSMRQRTDAPR